MLLLAAQQLPASVVNPFILLQLTTTMEHSRVNATSLVLSASSATSLEANVAANRTSLAARVPVVATATMASLTVEVRLLPI